MLSITFLPRTHPLHRCVPRSHCCCAVAGVVLNMAALVLFGVSSSGGVNAFIPAAILLGLGNITFHLAQFHISALFPRSRGLVASVFVAGFTGCGIVMYLLMLIFENSGSSQWVADCVPHRPASEPAVRMALVEVSWLPLPCRAAYRTIMLSYAGICSLWIPLLAWMMPNNSFRVGMVYLMRKDWTFEVRLRTGGSEQWMRCNCNPLYPPTWQASR